MLTKNEILDFLRNNSTFFKEHYHIVKIGLFGSFANECSNNSSDIDIIIELEDNTPNIFEMKQELRQFIEKKFNRSVDIAREKYLKKSVKQEILKETTYVK